MPEMAPRNGGGTGAQHRNPAQQDTASGAALTVAGRPGRPPGPPQTVTSRMVGHVPGGIRGFVSEVGGMFQLLRQILWSAVRYPRGYWGDVRDEIYNSLRLSWLPMVIGVFCFGLFVGILSLIFLLLIGANYLYGPVFLTTSMRDFSMWINAMVVAGVVGAALTADLGSRRIREELDALEVLGVNPVRALVLPRVISVTILTGLLSIVSVVIAIADSAVATAYMGHLAFGDFLSNVFNNVTPEAVVIFVVQATLSGLIIGVVCAYKGLNAKGGAIGVGRAVNQAVVIAFVGIWVLQFGYTAVVLALFPTLGTAR